MLLNPAVIALLLISWLTCGFALYAVVIGDRIVQSWDLASGSAQQLALERQTYLITHIFAYLMAIQLFSLVLFIRTADQIHPLFVGAMCAAGTLNVNGYGYPTLLTKLLTSLLCGIWLILNHVDNRGHDYPLIRPKYKFLMVISGLLLVEAYLQTNYFWRIRAEVITSCCGALFSKEAPTLGGILAGLPPRPMQFIFYLALLITICTGTHFMATGKAAGLYAILSAAMLLITLAAVIAFISVYYYQMPTHHCPFCLLQKEYGHIGYLLYASLLLAGISGISMGVMEQAAHIPSITGHAHRIQRRCGWVSLTGYIALAAIATYPMVLSDFKLIV